MIRVDLPRFGRFEVWRRSARHLMRAGIAPDQIVWCDPDSPPDLFGADPPPPTGDRPVRASTAFLDMARQIVHHSDPERFALLYAALLRFQAVPGFLANPADPMRDRLGRMVKSVRRDIHKMHAFLRFHEIPASGPRRSFGAWFEPQHPILEAAVPFFARRFADMDWLIATPEGIARFDGSDIRFEAPAPRPDLPDDAQHALWATYFANIFNPARVKVTAMRSEMPLRYWKNLPETRLIPDMLADAPRRVQAMAEAGATPAPARAARVTARIRSQPQDGDPVDLAQAERQAATCTRCALYHDATRTVFGEGDPNAALMIVGEAPSDHEDLQGRPFIGPAGQLLRQTLARAGIAAERVWLTNAVKHFKFAPRGKRRLHQTPTTAELRHCRWWLTQERRLVQPRLTVALGASAAWSLTGNAAALTPRRGGIEPALDGGPVLITWHPALILRLNPTLAAKARAQLCEDLAQAARRIA